MTNRHLALQIRNRLQRYGVQADPDALLDVVYEALVENSDDIKPTLRDQFAMHIMSGTCVDNQAWNVDRMAEWAYLAADAMINTRNKSTE